MQELERLYDTGTDELGGLFLEPASVPQDGPDLSPEAHLHQHVDVLCVPECLVKPGRKNILKRLFIMFLRNSKHGKKINLLGKSTSTSKRT